MARGDRGNLRERRQLRETLQQQGRTPEQIAAAMAQQFGDRPRPAWRHAYGWTQDEVAARFNEAVGDEQASMTGNRISDYERWPRKGGIKPTVRALGILAAIYSTRVLNLIDSHDRKKLDAGELLSFSAVESVVVPRQLPGTISHFVGRVRELNILTAQLNRAATAGGVPVIITSIGGTAGIGKTTLAIHWARTHIDQFPDGQLYINLRGFDPSGTPITPAAAIRGFLDAFHIPAEKIPATLDAQTALYRTLVEGKRLVIVLDNARDTDQVLPLLPGSPSCIVLVTSRQQLAGLIAHKQALHITLEFLTTREACQLLTDFLGTERIRAEPEAVDELIQRCVGLPIALSVAAAHVLLDPRVPLNILLSELSEQRQRLDALSTGDSQLTDIRAVFSWSYSALSRGGARLFRLLGLHPGPDIGLYAAASLVGLPESDTRRLLTELTRAYLLKQHFPSRYQIHDLLRVYATEQATQEEPEPQQRTALHRVLDYYLHTGFTADRHLAQHREPIVLQAAQSGTMTYEITDCEQAWEWFATEHAVLLAAIDRAATNRFDTHAWQLPWTLATFLNRRGHWHDYIAIHQTALAAASRLGDRAVQANIRLHLGHAYTWLERYTEANIHLELTLTLYQELGDSTGQAHIHLSLGWICDQQGQHSQTIIHAQQALDLYRTTNYRIGEANTLNVLGGNYARLGHYPQALTHCQQAMDLHRELDNIYGQAATLGSLGYIYNHIGRHSRAISCYQNALALFREFNDRYYEADTLTHLGDIHHATGNHSDARDNWQQALAILDQLDHFDAEQVRAKLVNLDIDLDGPTANDQL